LEKMLTAQSDPLTNFIKDKKSVAGKAASYFSDKQIATRKFSRVEYFLGSIEGAIQGAQSGEEVQPDEEVQSDGEVLEEMEFQQWAEPPTPEIGSPVQSDDGGSDPVPPCDYPMIAQSAIRDGMSYVHTEPDWVDRTLQLHREFSPKTFDALSAAFRRFHVNEDQTGGSSVKTGTKRKGKKAKKEKREVETEATANAPSSTTGTTF
jgi:hypothetical protein